MLIFVLLHSSFLFSNQFFLPTNSCFDVAGKTLVNAVAEINYLYCAHFSLEHKTLFGNLRTLHYIFQCTNYGTFVCDDGLFIRVETGLTRKLLTLFFFSFFFSASFLFVFFLFLCSSHVKIVYMFS